jgi:hypothetical protein
MFNIDGAATDESSSNGSSVDKDNKHGAKGDADYDWGYWEDNALEKTKFEGPSYSLKIRVWPSCGYVNILIFGEYKYFRSCSCRL